MSLLYKNCSLLLISLLFYGFSVAQTIHNTARNILPMRIEISTTQTSVLLFPAAIKSVDRGSRNILTKTVKEIDNVLKIKAASDTMQPTNLHVFTADGQLYPFTVIYHPQPAQLTIDLTSVIDNAPLKPNLQFSANRLNDAMVAYSARYVSALPPIRNQPKSRYTAGMRLQSSGIYYTKGVLLLQFKLVNASAIPYKLDFTRIYVRDKKRSNRSSVTETTIQPLYIAPLEKSMVATHTAQYFTIAFDQFTIADNKHLIIELFELNGDRSITCKLKGKDLLRATTLFLPDTPPPLGLFSD